MMPEGDGDPGSGPGPGRSPAAQEASRRNGARSRGPRTGKGKRRSARNAFKHGLRARRILDPALFPPWLVEIERDAITLLGAVGVRQRELLDQLLLSCLQLAEVDGMIAAAKVELFALADDGHPDADGAPPHMSAPSFLLQENADALKPLVRLEAYRRRFRGRRDRCLASLFPPRLR